MRLAFPQKHTLFHSLSAETMFFALWTKMYRFKLQILIPKTQVFFHNHYRRTEFQNIVFMCPAMSTSRRKKSAPNDGSLDGLRKKPNSKRKVDLGRWKTSADSARSPKPVTYDFGRKLPNRSRKRPTGEDQPQNGESNWRIPQGNRFNEEPT